MWTRRNLLRAGALGGGTLLLARFVTGCERWPADSIEDAGHPFRFLEDDDRRILAAIVPVILESALPTGHEDETAAVREVVRAWDAVALAASPTVRSQLRELLGTLAGNPVMRWIAGVPSQWGDRDAVDDFLASWRTSREELVVGSELRLGYLALVRLTMVAWYSNPRSWALTGYAGAPALY